MSAGLGAVGQKRKAPMDGFAMDVVQGDPKGSASASASASTSAAVSTVALATLGNDRTESFLSLYPGGGQKFSHDVQVLALMHMLQRAKDHDAGAKKADTATDAPIADIFAETSCGDIIRDARALLERSTASTSLAYHLYHAPTLAKLPERADYFLDVQITTGHLPKLYSIGYTPRTLNSGDPLNMRGKVERQLHAAGMRQLLENPEVFLPGSVIVEEHHSTTITYKVPRAVIDDEFKKQTRTAYLSAYTAAIEQLAPTFQQMATALSAATPPLSSEDLQRLVLGYAFDPFAGSPFFPYLEFTRNTLHDHMRSGKEELTAKVLTTTKDKDLRKALLARLDQVCQFYGHLDMFKTFSTWAPDSGQDLDWYFEDKDIPEWIENGMNEGDISRIFYMTQNSWIPLDYPNWLVAGHRHKEDDHASGQALTATASASSSKMTIL